MYIRFLISLLLFTFLTNAIPLSPRSPTETSDKEDAVPKAYKSHTGDDFSQSPDDEELLSTKLDSFFHYQFDKDAGGNLATIYVHSDRWSKKGVIGLFQNNAKGLKREVTNVLKGAGSSIASSVWNPSTKTPSRSKPTYEIKFLIEGEGGVDLKSSITALETYFRGLIPGIRAEEGPVTEVQNTAASYGAQDDW